MLRTGRVSSVDAKRHTARVEFSEGGGFAGDDESVVSGDYPVLVTRTDDYSLPAVGALVLCAVEPGAQDIGYVLGTVYSDSDAPPTDDGARRVVAGDDLRLGDAEANEKVALALKVRSEISKVVTYVTGVANAIRAGVPIAQDGGANLKATMVAALPEAPSIESPAAQKVSAT